MKKTISFLSNLLVFSTLLWGVSTVSAQSTVTKSVLDDTGYCHMQFPAIREDTLSWSQPLLDEASGNIIDFYGSCNHDPLGADEVRAQSRVYARGAFGDGESGSDD